MELVWGPGAAFEVHLISHFYAAFMTFWAHFIARLHLYSQPSPNKSIDMPALHTVYYKIYSQERLYGDDKVRKDFKIDWESQRNLCQMGMWFLTGMLCCSWCLCACAIIVGILYKVSQSHLIHRWTTQHSTANRIQSLIIYICDLINWLRWPHVNTSLACVHYAHTQIH